MNDQRRFTRIDSDLTAQVEFSDNSYWGRVLDLSLKGVLVNLPENSLPLEAICEIKIPLHSNGVVMSFHSTLVHRKENNFGFRFENGDLQSVVHLRRLLELNVDDPQKIRKELFFLVDRENGSTTHR